MKPTGNKDINTAPYWNKRYTDRNLYEQETGLLRFATALHCIKSNDRVLDIGCGVGTFTRMVKYFYPSCEVWGTDISDKAIKDNRKQDADISYVCSVVGHQSGLNTNYFDVVFSGEVLEHLEVPKDLFADAYLALKDGGIFIITTPYLDSIRSPEHLHYFNHADVFKLYTDFGFTDIQTVKLPFGEDQLVIMMIGKK